MGMFDEALAGVRAYTEKKEGEGVLKRYPETRSSSWPRSTGILLKKDTGLELGNPSLASQYFLIWTAGGRVDHGTVTVIGPDLPETTSASIPFAQIVLVRGSFEDDYEGYRELRDVLYELKLEGFATRSLPGRQSIWCRVSKEALAAGFSLKELGGALIEELERLDEVEAAEVIFVTSNRRDVEDLGPIARNVRELVEAMIKMYEQMVFDCETCEYRDVCDSVQELKDMKERLLQKRGSDG